MADTYEQNLGQKSSLSVSDYIRMVGSDNVSYKQSARSVAELMSIALPYSTETEVLTWAEGINGRGICFTNTSTTDLPTEQAIKYGIAWTYNYVSGGSVWLNVFWTPTNRAEIYYNTKTGTNAWLGWQKMPTRAEIDELNNNRGKITEVITLNNGLSAIGICQQLSSLMDANTGFQCQVFSSGRRYVCGYQYGPKSYGAFLVMTYTGTLEFVWNNNGTWGSRNL